MFVVCFLYGSGASGALDPSPQEIRERTQEILAKRTYDLENQTELDLSLLRFLAKVFEPVIRFLGRLSLLPPLATRIIVALCISALLGILAHTLYAVYAARHKTHAASFDFGASAPGRVDPAQMVGRARELAAQGNYVDASRTLYRAALALLEDKRGGHVRVGLTNTEYLRTFRLPWVKENLRVFVDLINWKWYRARNFDADDYAHCSRAFENIETQLKEEF